MNISEIVRQLRMNHNNCSFHLKNLTEMGVLQEKIFGRIKIYKYRLENVKLQALRSLIELWNE